MVKRKRPWLWVMFTSLALTASCGDEATPELDEEEEEEENEQLGPTPEEACMDTADSLVLMGSSDHAGSMDGLQHLAVLDGMLYGCAENSGVAMWDVSNLAAPTLTRGDPAGLGSTCSGLAINQSTRRMAVARPDSIELYSLDDETTPALIASHPQTGVVDLAFSTDGRLYAAAEAAGVFAYEVSDDIVAPLATHADAQSDARAVAAAGSTIVVAEGRTGVRSYALNGTQLVPSAPVGVTGTAVEVALDGFSAYVATLEGVAQIDVADPLSPRTTGFNLSPGTAMNMSMAEGALWVSDWTGALALEPTTMAYATNETLVSDPPSLLNRTAAVLFDEGRLFLAHWNGIRVYAPCGTSGPALRPDTERMEFNNALVGEPKAQVIVLRNLGSAPLVVSDLSTDHSSFTVEAGGFEIPPGGSAPIEVTYTAANDLPTYGNVIVTSNDPDESTRMLSMAANIPRAPVGSIIEPFHDVDTNGQTWRPQDLQGKVAMLSYFAMW